MTYILTIFFGIIISFNLADSKTSVSSHNEFSQTDILEKLKKQKTYFDTLWNKNQSKLIVFVKLIDKKNLVEVKNGNWVDGIETTFILLKDDNGKIIVAKEIPDDGEIGDVYITFSQYFDKDGKTFSYERQTNFFHSGCTDGAAYETKTKFNNSNLQAIGKEYKLVDEKYKPLPKDSCAILFDFRYKVLPNVETYLQTKKIKNGQ